MTTATMQQAPQTKTNGAVQALSITDLQAWYGESHILHNVNLTVNQGEVVTLLGRNGAGRTTTLRSIMGLVGARKGSIKINGNETIAMATHKIAHQGVGYCPEERGIFSSLSLRKKIFCCRHMFPKPIKACRLKKSTTCFPIFKNAAIARAHVCPVANSKCWR